MNGPCNHSESSKSYRFRMATAHSPKWSSDFMDEGECDTCNAQEYEPIIKWRDLQRSAAQETCRWCYLMAKVISVLKIDANTNDMRFMRSISSTSSLDMILSGRRSTLVDIFVTQSEIAPAWIRKQRIPSASTSSLAALQWTKEWLDYCQGEHMMCRHAGSFDLPTRLIDVTPINEHGDVKLVLGSTILHSERYTGGLTLHPQ